MIIQHPQKTGLLSWQNLYLIALIWGVYFLILPSALRLGVQADEGVHLTVAQEVAHGQAVYRDLFENRTPAAEWLLAGVIWLGGRPLESGRLLAIGATLISSCCLITLTRRILQQWSSHIPPTTIRGASLAAGTLYLLTPLTFFWSRFFIFEPFVTLLALLAALALLQAITRDPQTQPQLASFWFLSGLALGLAILVKQTALVTTTAHLVFLAIYFALPFFSQTAVKPHPFKTWGKWGVGFLLPLIAFSLLLISQGSVDDFQQSLSGAGRLAPFEGLPEKITLFFTWAFDQPVILVAFVGGLSALSRWRQQGAVLLFPLLWVGAEFSALFLPAELDLSWGGFSHYLLPALASASLLAGIGLGLIFGKSGKTARSRLLFPLVMLILVSSSLPAWWQGVDYVLHVSDYPQANQQAEQEIGQAVAGLVPVDTPVLFFGNAGFYYWAQRSPITRFFHYPGYFAESETGQTAEATLLPIISRQTEPSLTHLLATRHHLDFRLPPTITQSIWLHWEPIALLPYSYQQDVLLFTPRQPIEPANQAVAVFAQTSIELNQLSAIQPAANRFLVRLVWRSEGNIDQPYTTFVHVLRPDGSLVAQHDSQPGVGFRPTTSWQTGELINDYHWISLPDGEEMTDYDLSVGLYNSATGERLLLEGEPEQSDYRLPVMQSLEN